MSSFKTFDIAGSGMAAQSVRLNTVASNLANADSVAGSAAAVYKARHPLFEAVRQAMNGVQPAGANGGAAVRVRGIVESDAAPVARYEPGNPLANAEGYVYAPNVNVVEEMIDLIAGQRAYEVNSRVVKAADEMLQQTANLR